MFEVTAERVEQILTEKQDIFILFVHTPLCGTCKMAASMLAIMEKTYPQLEVAQLNINQYPLFAQKWHIQSVPCLLIFQKGLGVKRVYAFHSIPSLYSALQSYLHMEQSRTIKNGE